MKLIIAGSRTVDKYRAIYEWSKLVMTNLDIRSATELVTGCCPKGADRVPYLINDMCPEEGTPMPIKEFPADWDTHGKAAGFIRNKQMAEYADELLLIWDGVSKGSANMKYEMERLDKPVHEVIV